MLWLTLLRNTQRVSSDLIIAQQCDNTLITGVPITVIAPRAYNDASATSCRQ